MRSESVSAWRNLPPLTNCTRDTLSELVQPPGFFTHRADRNKHLSGKNEGGSLCLMINETWCDHYKVQELQVLLFTWPRIPYNQMSTALSTKRILFDHNQSGVYSPPQADTSTDLKEFHLTLCKLETTYPEAAFIVPEDLNKANLRKTLSMFYQHIDCSKLSVIKTLDHWFFQNPLQGLPPPALQQIWSWLHFALPFI